MKKINKKGFTLIELLAVIIILGVLMIIAIPAVTKYINDSRKSGYVNSAAQYVDAVSKEVVNGKDLKLYSKSTLYLVAVGHDKTKSCISLESGGKSPYSDTWTFAYVGVVPEAGGGNDYYFISQDGSGKKLGFIDNKELVDKGTSDTYFDKAIPSDVVTVLSGKYGTNGNTEYTLQTDLDKFAAEIAITGKSINKIVVINPDSSHNGKCVHTDS